MTLTRVLSSVWRKQNTKTLVSYFYSTRPRKGSFLVPDETRCAITRTTTNCYLFWTTNSKLKTTTRIADSHIVLGYLSSARSLHHQSSDANEHLSSSRLPVGNIEEPEQTVESLGIYDQWISFYQGYVESVAHLLEILYDTLGIPWYALIALTTITVRLLLLPITISSMRSISIMKCLQPHLNEIHKKTADATSRYNDDKLLELKREYLQLMKKYRADPLKNFYAPFIQTPIVMSLYWGVRHLRNHQQEASRMSLSDGGIAWFRDLTVPDPHYILPFVFSTVYLITLRIARDTMAVTSNDAALFSARAITILCFPLTLKLPALVFCYLLPNSCFTLLLHGMLRYPRIRQRLGFPTLDGQLPFPIKEKTPSDNGDNNNNERLSKAEREAMSALSYLKQSRYSSLLFAAKRGMKPRLYEKPTKSSHL
jgi:YidC/Oxa1 family membrane protein insertase